MTILEVLVSRRAKFQDNLHIFQFSPSVLLVRLPNKTVLSKTCLRKRFFPLFFSI